MLLNIIYYAPTLLIKQWSLQIDTTHSSTVTHSHWPTFGKQTPPRKGAPPAPWVTAWARLQGSTTLLLQREKAHICTHGCFRDIKQRPVNKGRGRGREVKRQRWTFSLDRSWLTRHTRGFVFLWGQRIKLTTTSRCCSVCTCKADWMLICLKSLAMVTSLLLSDLCDRGGVGCARPS